MPNLLKYHAKICLTAAGVLIHNKQVLLIKHKKLSIWLPPGGHIEPEELPHLAAKREFKEETGLDVVAYTTQPPIPSTTSQYLPTPFAISLHWISQDNYHNRLKSTNPRQATTSKKWPLGCEQHLSFIYLVKLKDSQKSTYTINHRETDDIGWFSQNQL